MTTDFQQKWLKSVDETGSVLCAGLDPAQFEMGRGEKGLAQGVKKRDWALEYVEAIGPYCAAIKPNLQYWQGTGNLRKFLQSSSSLLQPEDLMHEDMQTLLEVYELAKSFGMVVIEDKKLADIGETNDSGIFYAGRRADAVTLALYAGNMAEAAKDLKARGIGGIHMCIMSNPDYAREKIKLVPLIDWRADGEDLYSNEDVVLVDGTPYVPQFIQLAHDAKRFGLDGLVIGAPSKKNHIKPEEIKTARIYAGDEMLVLLPGVGAQGGEASSIWKYFGRNNVIVNVGRDLMFPNGSDSTSEQQIEKARFYRDMLNDARK